MFTHRRQSIAPRVTILLLALSLFRHQALADGSELVVAISPDIPPYVMQQAATGLEVDIVHAALPGFSLRFVQIPYKDLQTAIGQGLADVSVGVRSLDDGVSYSNDFVTFANYAITKRADGLSIDDVKDLSGHQVLAWQRAYLELGGEFEQLFSPGSPQRRNYTEFARQIDQVRMFWQGTNKVIVIDGSIFAYFSEELGHSMSDVVFHAILSPVTNFKVGFKDAAACETFNQGLAELCRSGQYARLLDRYDVEVPNAVCEREAVREAAARFYSALNAMFRGDLSPMKEVWSHADDVTYMGPGGGLQVGWQQVLAAWKEQASMNLEGTVEPRNMYINVGRDIAVTHNDEIGENVVDGKRQVVSIRATNLFRRENGKWKMIGHHTDLLSFLDR